MPEQVRCPSCEAPLRVPDNLLGKNVKCPKCQETFIAEMEEPAEPKGVVREPAPARRSRAVEEPEEEEYLEEEEDEEERPRQRKRGRRRTAAAAEAVSGPATALLVVGIIDIVLGGLNLLGAVVFFALMSSNPNLKNNEDFKVNAITALIIGICALVLGPLITAGAVKMKRLTSYGFAMTACFLAMIPGVQCCLLGLPFGIWALVVLNKPEVKDGFQ